MASNRVVRPKSCCSLARRERHADHHDDGKASQLAKLKSLLVGSKNQCFSACGKGLLQNARSAPETGDSMGSRGSFGFALTRFWNSSSKRAEN